MSWPPMLMHIKVRNHETNFGLWLPLFLLAPLVLVIILILSPLILIALIVFWCLGWGRIAWFTIRMVFVSLWNLHGLKIDVQNPKETVFISIV
jgi:hypothetical protein